MFRCGGETAMLEAGFRRTAAIALDASRRGNATCGSEWIHAFDGVSCALPDHNGVTATRAPKLCPNVRTDAAKPWPVHRRDSEC
jgi:hypothetical protein